MAKIKNNDRDDTDDNNAPIMNFQCAISTTPPSQQSEQASSPRYHFDAHQYHYYSPLGTKHIVIQAPSPETTATPAITSLTLITIPSAQPPRVHYLLGCQIRMQAN